MGIEAEIEVPLEVRYRGQSKGVSVNICTFLQPLALVEFGGGSRGGPHILTKEVGEFSTTNAH
jgi:hypothetical protein